MKIANVLLILFSLIEVIAGRGHQQVELEGKVPEVSKNHDKVVSVPDFMSLKKSVYPNDSSSSNKEVTDHTTTPIQSIVDAEKRELSGCMTFAFSQDNGDNYYQDNYVDVNGSGTTLDSYCNLNNCCHQDDFYNDDVRFYDDMACGEWSTDSTVEYTVCPGTCVGPYSCRGVAYNAGSGSSIIFQSGSCSSKRSCERMASSTTMTLNLSVGSDSCTNESSCFLMARDATNLEELSIGSQSCTQTESCFVAAYAASMKQLIVDDGQCDSSDYICGECGYDSTFDETLQLTETCCAAVSGESYGNFIDEACNYTPPPEEPEEPTNPCKNVSCSNRGKCQVLSLTEAECQCENTFIQSENKLDCICPSNHEFHADANRCFPITEAPSKSPTISPTKTSSASPSQVPTASQEDVCEDDETATFQLIKMDKNVPCSWISKNWKKRAIREEKYCGLDEVKAICPATCGLCS